MNMSASNLEKHCSAKPFQLGWYYWKIEHLATHWSSANVNYDYAFMQINSEIFDHANLNSISK